MKYILIFLMIIPLFTTSQNYKVQSPDGKIVVSAGTDGSLPFSYAVSVDGAEVIRKSEIGFHVKGAQLPGKGATVVSSIISEVKKSWKPLYGERSAVTDHYNLLKITLNEKNLPSGKCEITFRVYNEGVAFNCTFFATHGNDSLLIQKETTSFNFLQNYDCWVSERAQSEIFKTKVSSITKSVDRPALVEAGDFKLAIGEAKLVDFARMKLISGENENSLMAILDGEAVVKLPYTTPWRTIMIGRSEGELLANNFFYENLNDECAIADVSWIKPGKVIREVTLTTQGGIACVDFAAANGLQYVEFDAGWYGHEYDDASDATVVNVDPKRSPGPLDLQYVIDYGKSKGIGIILYINRRALEKQLDVVLPLYKSWGVKGVKYGFVQVGTQEWTNWLHKAVKKASENELMVDIHDEYRPTGFSRTYPNLLTQEGIRGDEESPSNEHTLKTLFTRMLAGAGDNTNCYYAPRVTEKMGGHVSQLAKAVMIYSPWQFLYWYDRPDGSPGKKGGAGDSDGFIKNHPELEFFKKLPTVWDETKILEGEIGQFATIARRAGDDWFLGSLTATEGHKITIDFGFLNSKGKYEAVIYSHDPQNPSSTKIRIEKGKINSKTKKQFYIAANSGLAIRIRKI